MTSAVTSLVLSTVRSRVRKRTSALRIGASRPNRILICRPNARLGNTLLITPLVQEIERTWPGVEIDILSACPAAQEIFRAFACVRRIHLLPRCGLLHPIGVLKTLLQARLTKYDLAIDPCPRSRSSRFATRLMRATMTLGFTSHAKRRGVDIGIPAELTSRHMGVYPVQLLRRALEPSRVVGSQVPPPTIALTAEERAEGRRRLWKIAPESTSSPVVAMALNATGAKRVAMEWWRELLSHLSERKRVQVVEIVSVSGQTFLSDTPRYYSSDVRRVAAVIEAADCFVSADSGLMHLGAATTTPTIGLFKMTDPAMYAAYARDGCGIRLNEHSTAFVAAEIIRRLDAGRERWRRCTRTVRAP